MDTRDNLAIGLWTPCPRGNVFQEIWEALIDAGCLPYECSCLSLCGPGICVTDHWTNALADSIAKTTQQGRGPLFVVLDLNGSPAIDAPWLTLAAGAADVFMWRGVAREIVAGVCARVQRLESVEQLLNSDRVRSRCCGRSAVWIRQMRLVVEAAAFSSSPVLLTGESGTGKELVAQIVHDLDARTNKGDFVTVDCSTIVRELSGSELFGHVRGAFTGAVEDRPGACALADGGTLFLDEVGELPMPMQAELLRVLQEGTYKPVGSSLWRDSSFRLIAATNRDLEQELRAGRFRHDLYFRLTGGSVFHLPPLRERSEDILTLAQHFLEAALPADINPRIAPELETYLRLRDYPGNIRQLKALMGRLALRYPGAGDLTLGMIPPWERASLEGIEFAAPSQPGCDHVANFVMAGMSLKEIGRQAEEAAIREALRLEQGHVPRAAKRLRISDRALQLRIATKPYLNSQALDLVSESETS
ncbi:MAG TPA: sigma 54-interacting transcriptional regulator [Pirellulaceae bacterium]|nr:sigma 54-interacting transcriptional regulator [Pirellulaceae bacterium]